jgi:hypothetical protein
MLCTMNDTPAPAPAPAAPAGLYPCPACGTPMTAIEPCPNCGRAPDPRAPRLVAVDRELAGVAVRLDAARRLFGELTQQWNQLSAERHDLARQMYSAVVGERIAMGPPGQRRPHPVAVTGEPKEPQTIQNLLFVIGGILLGVGAIVFTVVAWSRYGMTGRIAILATATLIALAIPLVAVRRSLRATAETFTAIGLLLVALDGIGIWRLDVFGVRERFAGSTYAGIVLAVLATVAFAYGEAVKLTGPRFVALIVAQPILPLLSVSHQPDGPTTAAVLTIVAALDFLVAHYDNARAKATMVVAAIIGAVMLLIGTVTALASLFDSDRLSHVLSGAAVVCAAAAVTLVVASRLTERDPRNLLVTVAVLGVVVAAARTTDLALHGHLVAISAAITAVMVGIARAVRPRLRFAAGTAAAAWCVTAVTALNSVGVTLAGTIERAARLHPVWASDLSRVSGPAIGPSVPIAIAVGSLGAAILAGKGRRRWITLIGSGPVVLAIGLLAGARWWTAPVVDELGIIALVAIGAVHLRRGLIRPAAVASVTAAALAVHAALESLARPELTAAIVAGLAAIGIAATIALRRHRRLAGGAFVVALLAAPFAAVSLAAAYADGPVLPMRVGLAAIAVEVIALIAVRRSTFLQWYAVGAISGVAITISVSPLIFPSDERLNLYAMTGRLLIALAVLSIGLRGRPARLAMIPGDLLGLLAIGRILPVASTVLLQPYAWLAHIWQGDPHTAGITPSAYQWHLDSLDIVTAVLFAASLTASGAAMRGRRGVYEFGVPTGSLAVLVALVAAGVSWPAVPVASLALGGAAVLAGVLPRTRSGAVGWCGLLFAGAGLAGLLATRPATIVGLGATVVLALVIAVTARGVPVRAAAWVAAVVAADLLAIAAVLDDTRGLGDLSFGLLAASAIASLISPLIRGWGRSEAEMRALDATVHGGLFVALALSGGYAHGAIVACGWGVLVAIRARTALTTWGRTRLSIAAGGLECVAWCLLVADHGIHTVDVYSVPLAVYAYVTGVYVHRLRPELGSWVTFGPALLAGFGPSLVLALGADPTVTRRLVVGGLAVLAVLAGARFKLQAQVVIAGAVAIVLALQELVLAWQRLPAWIPLTAAGLLLIVVASTYERRRRDWTRMRASLRRMT